MRTRNVVFFLFLFVVSACRGTCQKRRLANVDDAGATASASSSSEATLPKPPPTGLPPEIASSSSSPSEAENAAPIGPEGVIRDETRVHVNGYEELWRLVWRSAPSLDCADPNWPNCTCNGIAFGETGKLVVVRIRVGEPEDRLDLGTSSLQKWKPTEAEIKAGWSGGTVSAPDPAGLQKRPVTKVINVADYDHDGASTEFVLQTGAGPCFHKSAALIGITRYNPKLHIFKNSDSEDGDAAASIPPVTTYDDQPPIEEIFLEPAEWEKVRAGLPKTFITVPCGDHGAEQEERIQVLRAAKGLRAIRGSRRCGKL